MAIKKSCDYCDQTLGKDSIPFLQMHGSLSEQCEDGKGSVMFRYLTEYFQKKLAFCDTKCLIRWIEKQRETKVYKQNEIIPADDRSDELVIHT